MERLATFLVLALFILASSAQKGSRRPQKEASKGDVRIVGGVESTIERYPYVVSLHNMVTQWHFCGGSIISPYYILTAAHCTITKSPQGIYVVAGTTDLLRETTTTQKRRVRSIINHPGYNSPQKDNDVALLRLVDPLQLNSVVKTIELDHNEFKDYDFLFVAGWGVTSDDAENSSNILKAVAIPGIPRDACERYHNSGDVVITNNMICAGFNEGTVNKVCFGDSGGPAVSFDSKKQVGVVSWGRACSISFPDVYANVARYIHWIRSVTGLPL